MDKTLLMGKEQIEYIQKYLNIDKKKIFQNNTRSNCFENRYALPAFYAD